MKLIAGLGNPGEKYQTARHNAGFMALDALLKEFESVDQTVWEENKRVKAHTKQIEFAGNKFILAKPATFMNNSGFAVAHLANFYKVKPEEIAVIYDDLDLPLGKIRIRFGGAAGGHKGVESIIQQLNNDGFLRIRLGIGHPHHHDGKLKEGKSHIAVEDYVLQPFAANEKSKVRHMIKEASKSVHLILEHGIDLYMSKYNGEIKTEKSKIKTANQK